MKQCPKCYRNYEDETFSFCLEDGTILITFSDDPNKSEVTHIAHHQTQPSTEYLPDKSELTHIAYYQEAPPTEYLPVNERINNLPAATIATDIFLIIAEIERELSGALYIKSAAKAAAQVAGHILTSGLEAVSVHRIDPGRLKDNLLNFNQKISTFITESGIPLNNRNEIIQLLTTCSGNLEIARIITKAIDKLGREACITVEEGPETAIKFVTGLKFNCGYLMPEHSQHQNLTEISLYNPYILATTRRLTKTDEIRSILARPGQSINSNILIIAEDVSGEALNLLSQEAQNNTGNIMAAKAPGFGDRRRAMLEDIAIITGGRVFTIEDDFHKLSTTTASANFWGRAGKVVMDKDSTAIIDAKADVKKIHGRIEEIKKLHKETSSDYDREKFAERLAKLSGGVAIIKVGGVSDVERREKIELFNQALRIYSAADYSGFMPGANLTLVNIADKLRKQSISFTEEMQINTILAEAFEEPFKQMCRNAGKNPEEILQRLRKLQKEKNNPYIGYIAERNEFRDMVEAGIITSTFEVRLISDSAIGIALKKLANFL